MSEISIYELEKGEKFKVKSNNCTIDMVEFVSQGAAGTYEKGVGTINLEAGDIIVFDHVAYLGSDPGPGVPWFSKEDIGRGDFWPNDWGSISEEDIEKIKK